MALAGVMPSPFKAAIFPARAAAGTVRNFVCGKDIMGRLEIPNAMPDHVHKLLSIPSKYAVSQVVGFIAAQVSWSTRTVSTTRHHLNQLLQAPAVAGASVSIAAGVTHSRPNTPAMPRSHPPAGPS